MFTTNRETRKEGYGHSFHQTNDVHYVSRLFIWVCWLIIKGRNNYVLYCTDYLHSMLADTELTNDLNTWDSTEVLGFRILSKKFEIMLFPSSPSHSWPKKNIFRISLYLHTGILFVLLCWCVDKSTQTSLLPTITDTNIICYVWSCLKSCYCRLHAIIRWLLLLLLNTMRGADHDIYIAISEEERGGW